MGKGGQVNVMNVALLSISTKHELERLIKLKYKTINVLLRINLINDF